MDNNSKGIASSVPSFASATIGEFCVAVYKANAARGWWDTYRDPLQLCVLVNTEFAEAVEGDRKNLMDDHLPQFRMRNVELADAIIRMADIFGAIECGRYGDRFGDQGAWLEKRVDDFFGYQRILEFSREINRAMYEVSGAGLHFEARAGVSPKQAYERLMYAFLRTVKLYDYFSDNVGAEVDAKLAYNARRPDHSRAQRTSEGGKKY